MLWKEVCIVAGLKKLPLGLENFSEIRGREFYYVDKTKLIEEILNKGGKVNLFTRPRRFGKSLNMSMLRYFFEIETDKTSFEHLYISENKTLCEKYMGKFPVVSISLKGVDAQNFEDAYDLMAAVINEEAARLQFLLESDKLSDIDKKAFEKLLDEDMSKRTLNMSLRKLTGLLEKHYGEKVIVLIDEYDVPLAKANEQGYYDDMVLLLRNILGNVLKTNDSLSFAVLTGCLRIAKESIFTGLNNFKVYSITDPMFDEYFGFTDTEVRQMLHYYGLENHYEIVKQWYDGYRFGNVDVYCPWDVLNYCADHLEAADMPPKNYWVNTSGNQVINCFIDSVGEDRKLTKTELEQLVNGDVVQKEISEELTYKDLYASSSHLWGALFMTGYLTQRGEPDGKRYNLVVPNLEIRDIITEYILALFKDNLEKDGQTVNAFCKALIDGKPELVEKIFTEYMHKTISVRDTFVKKVAKENFYHGILLGILGYKGGWTVKSNKEAGDGYSDIMIRIDDSDVGIIIEVKYAEDENILTEGKKAMHQINAKHYTEEFHDAGIQHILKYGIVCNRKQCRVWMENE